ncbi:hypothetical protein DL769_003251 [Monosporascus sp. CRB-8-3]|nr:hypothetical protein DL769_003251 [Monosporascus sp. CRB-8-3]
MKVPLRIGTGDGASIRPAQADPDNAAYHQRAWPACKFVDPLLADGHPENQQPTASRNLTMATEYDIIIIIDIGPAGLSVASSIVRQDHGTSSSTRASTEARRVGTCAPCPSGTTATPMSSVPRPGPASDGAALSRSRTSGSRSVRQREEDGLFEATAGDARTRTRGKLILATGGEDVFPDNPGYWNVGFLACDCAVVSVLCGRYHTVWSLAYLCYEGFRCLYYHGRVERDAASAGMLAEDDTGAVVPALHFARQALRRADKVTLHINGNEQPASELIDAFNASPAPRARLTPHSDGGTSRTEAFPAHKPKARLVGLAAGAAAGPRVDAGGYRHRGASAPFDQTSVRGGFAAGGCANPVYAATAVLHSGTCAGGGAVAGPGQGLRPAREILIRLADNSECRKRLDGA